MKQLSLRICSAIFALIIPILCTIWHLTDLLLTTGMFLIFVGIHEYTQISFKPLPPLAPLRLLFYCASVLLSLLVIFTSKFLLITIYCFFPIFFALFLWSARVQGLDNHKLLAFLTRASLGLFYVAIGPALILKLLQFDDGFILFWFLLLTVFSGDIGAYFGGKSFKGAKLYPNLSPNKTVSGAICGFLCSALVGVWYLAHFYPGQSILAQAGLCLLVSFTAQTGDLFESLIKRVADVKDSGQIMPGHGGVLDRLDGIYFAAPIIYAAAFLYFDIVK